MIYLKSDEAAPPLLVQPATCGEMMLSSVKKDLESLFCCWAAFMTAGVSICCEQSLRHKPTM